MNMANGEWNGYAPNENCITVYSTNYYHSMVLISLLLKVNIIVEGGLFSTLL